MKCPDAMTEEPLTPNTDDIGARARTAVGWRALSQFSSQGVGFVTSIILARLLMPSDFGIIGMAGIVTGLAGVFQDLGFGQALVQRAELRPEHSRSAFWMTLIMGTLLYTALYLGAPWAGEFFQDERMVPVLRLTALSFLISPFGVVPGSLLQRELDFRRPFYAGLAGAVSSGSVGITMALLGYGYWSLVWGGLTGSVVGTIAFCIVARYAPPVVPSLRGARDLFSFGVGATGVALFNSIAGQVDYIIIGRRLDAVALGLYTRAFQLIRYPVGTVSITLYPVLFSSFATIQEDDARARQAYGRILTLLCGLAWPLLAILLVTAPEFIPVIFGEQWSGAVRATQIMVLAGMVKMLMNPSGAAAKAKGARYAYGETWRHAVRASLTGAAAWYGAHWGIEGVAWGITAVEVIAGALMLHLVYRATGFDFAMYVAALREPAALALLVLLAAWAGRTCLVTLGAGAVATLAGTAFLATAVGAAAMILIPWRQLDVLRSEVNGLSGRLRPRKV